jgi:hypothetical protein
MGTPEPVDSPNYGQDTADVSMTDPFIDATTNVVVVGTGAFNYYDGKIMGSLDRAPTNVEYLYEPCVFTDTSVSPSVDYTRLLWMRDGHSQCGGQ